MSPFHGVFAALLVTTMGWSAWPATFEVHVDVSQVPNARTYVELTKELVTEWYPKINAILFGKDYPLALKEVQVIFEPKSYAVLGSDRVEVPAREEEDIPRSIGRIHVNFSYLERVKYPYTATLIHELTHVNQQYKNYPEWLNEGMADYVRHKYFERDIEAKLLPLHGYQVDQVKLHKEGYLFGYTVAASFLFWLETRKDPGLILALNQALREGRYSETIFQQRVARLSAHSGANSSRNASNRWARPLPAMPGLGWPTGPLPSITAPAFRIADDSLGILPSDPRVARDTAP